MIPTLSPWVDEETFILTVGPDCALVHEDGTVLRVYEGSGLFGGGLVLPGQRVVIYDRDSQITTLDLDNGEVRTISELVGRPGAMGPVQATDGQQVWFTWIEERGDLWVMDVEG